MKIALWQTVPHHDPHLAVVALDRAARKARSAGAELMMAPEMTLGGYNVGADRCENLASQSTEFIDQISKICCANNIALVVGLALPNNSHPYNGAVAVDAAGIEVGRYHKIHLYGNVDRAQFTAGASLSEVLEIQGWKIGLAICYDIEFPEVARTLALKGADLILVPTANMAPFDSVATRLVPARAEENSVFVAYCNYIGSEGQFSYNGLSCVCGPNGHDLARAADDADVLLVADLDKSALIRARDQQSYLQDRRPALYDNAQTKVSTDE